MNQYFLEHQAREKLGQLRAEGIRSQMVVSGRATSLGTQVSLGRLIGLAASVLTVVLLLAP